MNRYLFHDLKEALTLADEDIKNIHLPPLRKWNYVLRRAEIFKSVIPSKMLEFMACSRPIILGVDGQARKIIESADAGIYIEPENATDLANAVIHLYNNPALCSKYGENGRRYIIKNFTRKEKAKIYLNIINDLVLPPPPSTS